MGAIAIAVLLLASPALADPPAPLDALGKVEVTLDLPKDKPYVGEMILLRMRSFVRADVVLDRIDQPPLLNFSWQQLGHDKPVEAMIGGFRVSGVERDLAIFPSTSGRLIIEPFNRHVTIVTADNQRVDTDYASKPVYVDVQNFTAINPPGAWWMPAAAVSFNETWSQPPDEIKPGTLARRTITIEALGLTGERLPPPPEVQAPGTLVFRGPVVRETIITDEGPVARGTYSWDLRPVSSSPAKLPAIHVSWFDTRTRRMRDSAIPEQWVALVGTLVHPSHEKRRSVGPLSAGPLAIGVAGFAWTAALLGFVLTARAPVGRRALRRARALAGLRARARADDEAGFARALVALARSDPARWRVVSGEPTVAERLRTLDRARYGRPARADAEHGGSARPPPAPLMPLAADIRRLWVAREESGRADAALPPLDGDAPRRRGWRERLRRGAPSPRA